MRVRISLGMVGVRFKGLGWVMDGTSMHIAYSIYVVD